MFDLNPTLARDTTVIGDLALCSLLLMNERQFPWVILVPKRNQVTEIFQLDKPDRAQLQSESHFVSEQLMSHFKGHKLNIAALGNLVPQLHIHFVVRYSDDACWPNPVWGNFNSRPYDEDQLDKRRLELQNLFEL